MKPLVITPAKAAEMKAENAKLMREAWGGGFVPERDVRRYEQRRRKCNYPECTRMIFSTHPGHRRCYDHRDGSAGMDVSLNLSGFG